MDGVGALDGKTLEHAVVDHRLRPGAAFLRGLEAEDERAVEFPVFREPARCAEQHRRMAVVAAGVHLPRRGGGIFGAARLQDRQGVHVGAQENALVRALRRALRAVQGAEDAGPAHALDDLVEAEGPQALGDDPRRARQIVGQLGVAVEIAPPFGELRDHGGDRVLQWGVHGGASCAGMAAAKAKNRR